MRTFLLAGAVLALAATPVLAQSGTRPAPVLTADAAAQPGPYCVVTGYTYGSASRMRFLVSYGENAPKPPDNERFIEPQKIEALSSAADMLNYFATRGWELAASTAAILRDEQLVYQYVLRKRATP